MSGRGEDRGGDSPRVWLRGALVVVAIVALLGAFGLQSGLQRPQLKPLNYAGIAVMGCRIAEFSLFRRRPPREHGCALHPWGWACCSAASARRWYSYDFNPPAAVFADASQKGKHL